VWLSITSRQNCDLHYHSFLSMSQNFYEVLGVPQDAKVEIIKKSYKKLAMKWHPDKNPENPDYATEMFKKIAEAYDTLSDPSKRRDYDDGLSGRSAAGFGGYSGYDGFGSGFPGGGGFASSSGRNGRSNFSSSRAFDIFEHFFADMDDMFGGMDDFGNGGGTRNPNPFAGGQFGGPGFGSMFGGGIFGGRGFDNGFGGGGGGGFTSFSSSSSTVIRGGAGRSGKSISTSTSIDSQGRRVTRTETTTYNADGTKDTKVDESHDDVPNYGRIEVGFGGGSNRGSGRDVAAYRSSNNAGSSSQKSTSRRY
jgi:curved DNA-binding protein CbpA